MLFLLPVWVHLDSVIVNCVRRSRENSGAMRGGYARCRLVLGFFVGICVMLLVCPIVVNGATDSGDLSILNAFKKGLNNPELLKWPDGDTDPCGNKWNGIYCNNDNKVSQIQFQNYGLEGTLPLNFNQLTGLQRISLQRNNLSGPLPTFNGLKNLQYCYLGTNKFDTIPADFFVGLSELQYFSLEYNNLNFTDGWRLPSDLQGSASLQNLSMSKVNLVGPIPDFLGKMTQLNVLQLAYNKLEGTIPSSFSGSSLKILQLNNQEAPFLSGPIDVLGTMQSLTEVWLHGNHFNGTIPESLGSCASLTDIRLNGNVLVGPIPSTLKDLSLTNLTLDSNKLTGPIPELNIPAGGFTYSGNSFCQSEAGKPCAPEVTALLDFLTSVNYPVDLAASWAGNNPCASWIGIACTDGNVGIINLPTRQLEGNISPSLVNLASLRIIKLNGNNLSGEIPANLTELNSLTTLNLSDNNLSPPVPKFSGQVTVLTEGNPLITKSSPISPASPPAPNPSGSPPSSPPPSRSTPPVDSPNGSTPSSGNDGKGTNLTVPATGNDTKKHKSSQIPVGLIVGSVAAGVVIFLLIPVVACCLYKKKAHRLVRVEAPSTVLVDHRGPSNNSDSLVKITVANNNGSGAGNSLTDTQSRTSSGPSEVQVMEAGNLVISVQVLRHVTRNFSPENELGRGGFGVVYKGQLDDGTRIAVKRMEAAAISTKGLNEFQSEIAVLSKVRHRHLVSLLGYCIEGNERLLVYEYMPQGALSRHIFDWAKNNLEPISWKRRLSIALDVARGMEYLHSLAHRSFIHRDLKPSNILLGDDFRAKVSDFGLVKLAPEGKYSIETRLAGTFGYLAPEYAVTGRITTKADVFSFGVVLMELITGRKALDENQPEESMHLVSWFRRMNSDKDSFLKAIDPVLEVTDETFESMCIIAELAGHCTAREPYQRPDMGHAVNVLGPLVEKWKPTDLDNDEYGGIDFDMSLPQALKKWQAFEDTSMSGLDDSKGSLPTRPTGFAESFTSADGR